MHFEYGGGWFRARRKMTRCMSKQQAQTNYAVREKMAIAAYDDDASAPFGFIELKGTALNVIIFDEHQRSRFVAQFSELEPGRLFMDTTQHRWFRPGSTEMKDVALMEERTLRPDGHVEIRRIDVDREQTWVSRTDGNDVGPAWIDYPAFGAFEPIFRQMHSLCATYDTPPVTH